MMLIGHPVVFVEGESCVLVVSKRHRIVRWLAVIAGNLLVEGRIKADQDGILECGMERSYLVFVFDVVVANHPVGIRFPSIPFHADGIGVGVLQRFQDRRIFLRPPESISSIGVLGSFLASDNQIAAPFIAMMIGLRLERFAYGGFMRHGQCTRTADIKMISGAIFGFGQNDR